MSGRKLWGCLYDLERAVGMPRGPGESYGADDRTWGELWGYLYDLEKDMGLPRKPGESYGGVDLETEMGLSRGPGERNEAV